MACSALPCGLSAPDGWWDTILEIVSFDISNNSVSPDLDQAVLSKAEVVPPMSRSLLDFSSWIVTDAWFFKGGLGMLAGIASSGDVTRISVRMAVLSVLPQVKLIQVLRVVEVLSVPPNRTAWLWIGSYVAVNPEAPEAKVEA